MDPNAPRTPSPWESHDRGSLDSYLVRDVEHPAINAQSVLIRSLLADSLFPNAFDALINDELRYSATALSILTCARQRPDLLPLLRDALLYDRPLPEAWTPPAFLRQTHPFDLRELFDALACALAHGFENFSGPYAAQWKAALDARPVASPRLAVLELACGSANDRRCFEAYGLARHIDYTGLDFTLKNIANARQRFPGATFLHANATALPFADKSFDHAFACDLLEHLDEGDLEMALNEALRVTRTEIWLSFFNLDWIPAHESGRASGRPLNTLSHDMLVDFFEKRGCKSYLVNVPQEWPDRFPGYRHYNDHATLLVVRV
jgi:SAM-dependent methyltransferase